MRLCDCGKRPIAEGNMAHCELCARELMSKKSNVLLDAFFVACIFGICAGMFFFCRWLFDAYLWAAFIFIFGYGAGSLLLWCRAMKNGLEI